MKYTTFDLAFLMYCPVSPQVHLSLFVIVKHYISAGYNLDWIPAGTTIVLTHQCL